MVPLNIEDNEVNCVTHLAKAQRGLRVLGLGLLLIACDLSERTTDASTPPTRIVLIVVDTLRRDRLSPYGAPVATPHIAALARRGQVFSNAVSNFHATTMSMAAMFTGRTPSLETGNSSKSLPWTGHNWCGLVRFAAPEGDTCIPAQVDTLAEDLSGAGYWTMGVVSNRLLFGPSGFQRGFDDWVEVGEQRHLEDVKARQRSRALHAAPRVHQAVLEVLARRPQDRFFLYVHYMDVHDWQLREKRRRYQTTVASVDHWVGELLGSLEAQGLLENTTVIFTADHGERLGDRYAVEGTWTHLGNPSFESVLRVPLIVAPATGADSSRLMRSQDLRNLVREMIGLATQPRGELEPDELLVSERFYQTYRRGRWKSMWKRGSEERLLFDLSDDPGETRDTAADHPDVIETHRTRVAELARRLGTSRGRDATLSEEDEARLQAMGYME